MPVYNGTSGSDNITGSTDNDTIDGGAGADTLIGGAGNDLIIGGPGGDVIIGGTGTDIASFETATGAVVINLTTSAHGGDATGDSFAEIEVIRGTIYNDTLTSGSSGAIRWEGGLGDDVYTINDSGTVVEAADAGIDEVRTSLSSMSLATNVENLTYVGSGSFSGNGNALNNVITGGAGNDSLAGGAGADTLIGGGGYDVVRYTASPGGVTINLATGTFTGDAAGDVFSGVEAYEGSAVSDLMIGDASANDLRGGNGDDSLNGGAGADTLDGGAGTDYLDFSAATAGVTMNFATGVYSGDAAGDQLISIEGVIGSAYNDTLTSSTTLNTTFRGGVGDDVYIVDANQFSDVIVEQAGEGTDEVRTALASYTLGANLERLTLTGSNQTGNGNALANTITAGAGNDTLVGGAGGDTLDGGAGVDVASYVDSAGGIVLDLATGASSGYATGDVFIGIEIFEGSNYNDTMIGDAAANQLRGGIGNDTLVGGAGADTLDGGAGTDVVSFAGMTSGVSLNLATNVHTGDAAGDSYIAVERFLGTDYADTMTSSASHASGFYGGLGDDIYVIDSASDAVTEELNAGRDEVRVTMNTYVLAANVEDLTYAGASNFSGEGNALDNLITGGGGADTLSGGAGGADTLSGGSGNDMVTYAAGSTVTINLATGVHGGAAAGDVFVGIEIVQGSAGADAFVGDSNNNNLQGGLGNDTIEGGAGADTLDGGGGTDFVSYAGATLGVSINFATSTYTGDGAGDLLTAFEGVIGSQYNDTLTSSAAVSHTLRGGAGDDIYVVDAAADAAQENVGEGLDEVRASAASYTLGANLERLIYTGATNFAGTGNASDNRIEGGVGNDTLDGGGGADTLVGGSGVDLVVYQAAATGVSIDLVAGTASGDAAGDVLIDIEGVRGSAYGDTLIGGGSANNFQGGSGDDLIMGGAGADTLDGGAGVGDIASYASAGAGVSLNLTTGSHAGDAAGDLLTGFEVFEGSGFADTLTGTAGNEIMMGGAGADQFVGGGGVNGLWYLTSGAGITIDLLTNSASGGDAAGDTFSGVRDVSGSIHNDSLIGNSGFNRLEGGGGDDTIFGGDGDDTIYLYAATQQLAVGSPLSNSSYVEGGAGNDSIYQGTEDTGSLIYGGDGNDTIRLWNGAAYGGAGNDAFAAPGQATMFGDAGSDTFTFQGTGSFANGGEDGDSYIGSQLGISIVSDTGLTGIDMVILAHAATSSALYWWLDVAADTMYFTTQSDMTDGSIDSGVAVAGWTGSRIERLMANDGTFVTF